MKKNLYESTISLIFSGIVAALYGSAVAPFAAANEILPARSCAELKLPRFNFKSDYNDYQIQLEQQQKKRRDCHKEWTVLIYMQADNNLEDYSYTDLYEMEAAYSEQVAGSSTYKTDVVVQWDRPGAAGIERRHIFQAPVVYNRKIKLEEIKSAGIRSPVIERVAPDPAKSEAARLQEFLEWGIREYPAEHYMVLAWGHGQGWAPAQTPGETPRTPIKDLPEFKDAPKDGRFGGFLFKGSEGSDRFVDIPSFAGILKKIHIERGKPIDVMVFDACLMQSIEVASEIASHAAYVVGSNTVQNYYGLPFRTLFWELNRGHYDGDVEISKELTNDEREALEIRASIKAQDSAERFARMVPNVFRRSFGKAGLQASFDQEGSKALSLSTLASDQLQQRLLPDLTILGDAILTYVAENPANARALKKLLQNKNELPSYLGGSRDLGGFLAQLEKMRMELLISNATVSPASRALQQAIAQAVSDLVPQRDPRKPHGPVLSFALGTDYRRQVDDPYFDAMRAISIWLPSSDAVYESRIEDFGQSEFYQRSHWGNWLSQLFSK